GVGRPVDDVRVVDQARVVGQARPDLTGAVVQRRRVRAGALDRLAAVHGVPGGRHHRRLDRHRAPVRVGLLHQRGEAGDVRGGHGGAGDLVERRLVRVVVVAVVGRGDVDTRGGDVRLEQVTATGQGRAV